MRALVTGAAGGMGSAMVALLAENGYQVLAQDLHAPSAKTRGLATATVTGDLLDPNAGGLKTALADAPLDCVVATHGIEGTGAVTALAPDRVRRIMRVNFLSMVSLLKLVEPNLAAARGAFVAISSEVGLVGEANNSAYCASKFGLVGWSRVVGRRLCDAGVRMRVLCPGIVDTELFRGAMAGFAREQNSEVAEAVGRRISQVPVGRAGSPVEMAATALYLAGLETSAPMVVAVTGGEVLR